MDNLKPCPFCGNKNTAVVVDNAEYALGLVNDEDVCFKVICSTTSCGCGASSAWCDTRQEAVDRWNKRKGEGDG